MNATKMLDIISEPRRWWYTERGPNHQRKASSSMAKTIMTPILVREKVARRINKCRHWLNEYACPACEKLLLKSEFDAKKSPACMSCSRLKHGMHRDRRYRVWIDMKRRATNPMHRQANDYMLRGIGVCNEWITFEGFSKWHEFGKYKPGMQLDRIDNDKGYSPDNCRWATYQEQQQNKRSNKFTPGDVRAIRMLSWSGLEISSIAKIFDTSYQQIWSIVKLKAWQNV